MTKQKQQQFCDKIDALAEEFKDDIENSDSSLETILYALVEVVKEDKKHQSNPAIIGCLEGVIESLRAAAFGYYASFK